MTISKMILVTAPHGELQTFHIRPPQ